VFSSKSLKACLGISGMKGNEGHWGGEISIISQNFSKSPSILLHPLESSISQTSPEEVWLDHIEIFFLMTGEAGHQWAMSRGILSMCCSFMKLTSKM
jgi:hypothetical protein